MHLVMKTSTVGCTLETGINKIINLFLFFLKKNLTNYFIYFLPLNVVVSR